MSKKTRMSDIGRRRYEWVLEWEVGDTLEDTHGRQYTIMERDDEIIEVEDWMSGKQAGWDYTERIPTNRCRKGSTFILRCDSEGGYLKRLLVNYGSGMTPWIRGTDRGHRSPYGIDQDVWERALTIDIPIRYWNLKQAPSVMSRYSESDKTCSALEQESNALWDATEQREVDFIKVLGIENEFFCASAQYVQNTLQCVDEEAEVLLMSVGEYETNLRIDTVVNGHRVQMELKIDGEDNWGINDEEVEEVA